MVRKFVDMKIETRAYDRGEKHILRQLTELGRGMSITSGVHKPEAGQTSSGSKTPIGVYAELNEYGLGVPERSFLRSTSKEKSALYARQTGTGMRQIYGQRLALRGLVARQQKRTREWIRHKIKYSVTTANAPATVQRKRRLRRGNTSPLMDTRALFGAITSKAKYEGGGLSREFKYIVRETRKLIRGAR